MVIALQQQRDTMSTINHQIYVHLHKLIPSLPTIPTYAKSKVSGYMDLNLDLLEQTSDKSIIALSHYYKHPSGDMIADPDMLRAIHPFLSSFWLCLRAVTRHFGLGR